MSPAQMSLLDPPVEPTVGRSRKTDPATSVAAGRSARVAFQRRLIARLLLTRDFLTADDVYAADLRPDDERAERGTYSSRLGDLVHDELMVKGDPVYRSHRGRERLVVTYHLTAEGRRWVREMTQERSAA